MCVQVGWAIFFPEQGESNREAKQVCRRCAVRQECLDTAVREGHRWGVWGGMSERERRPLHRSVEVPS